MTLYCDASWQTVLQAAELASFEQMWNFPIEWIEKPNDNRGGWSGAGRIEVLFENQPVILYVKKQLNHTRRTIFNPIKGIPTFAVEFNALKFLAQHGVATPKVVFFGQRQTKSGQEAILVTENLAQFQSLSEFMKHTLPIHQQRKMLAAIAIAIKKMHQLGMQHRALYPKHIFVNRASEAYQVALIDLEKAKRMVCAPLQSMNDLVTLLNRMQYCTKTSRLSLLKYYFGIKKLNAWQKLVCRWLMLSTHKK